MLWQAVDKVRNRGPDHCSHASGITFLNFSLIVIWPRPQGKNQKVCFSRQGRILHLSRSWLKDIIIRPLNRNRSTSPVGKVVTKVGMRVGNEAVDVLCIRKCYYRSIWLMWLKHVLGRATIWTLVHLASNYNQGTTINVKHVFIFVWGDEPGGWRTQHTSSLVRFNTVEYDPSATDNLFYSGKVTSHTVFKENPEWSADFW